MTKEALSMLRLLQVPGFLSHFKTNKPHILIVLFALLASTGCATIAKRGGQSITVETPGCVGANCKLSNKDGIWYVTTPGTVLVDRSRGDLTISCKHPNLGETEAVGSWSSSAGGWVWGNILVGGVIGAGVDMATGNAYDYPDRIIFPIDCAPREVALPGGSNTTSISSSDEKSGWSFKSCQELSSTIKVLPRDTPEYKIAHEQYQAHCIEPATRVSTKDRLEDINELFENGLITEEEYTNLRNKIIDNIGAMQQTNVAAAYSSKEGSRDGGVISDAGPAIVDSRDGQVYKTARIGNQWWMAENLRYQPGSDTILKHDQDSNKPQGLACLSYENNESYVPAYGYLYDWDTALDACPEGWHLPGQTEWQDLTAYLGGGNVAGTKMKEAGSTNWQSSHKNTKATNSSGFSALPGGLHNPKGSFKYLGDYAYFWTSTHSHADNKFYWYLIGKKEGVGSNTIHKMHSLSVRCIGD